MKLPASLCATLILPFCAASAQTPAPEAAKSAEAAQIETLAKKIDEQNTKIDALSQEILKLEQQISHIRPGIMIGESTPAPANAAASGASPSHLATGNTHIVARGETLTSIAKMYNVSVIELQKYNLRHADAIACGFRFHQPVKRECCRVRCPQRMNPAAPHATALRTAHTTASRERSSHGGMRQRLRSSK